MEQRSSNTNNGGLTIVSGHPQLPSTSSLIGSPLGNMTFKREPQLIEQQQQQLINVCQMPLNNNLPPGAQFTTIQQGGHIGGNGQQINIGGPISGNIIQQQDLKTGLTTKYVSYMQVIFI